MTTDMTTELPVKSRELQTVLAHLPDPLIHTDSQGTVVWHNPSASQFFTGLESGRNALELIDLPEVRQAFEQAIGGDGQQAVDIKWGGLKRRYLNIRLVSFSADRTADTSELQVLWSVHDMTAQRQLDKTRTDFVAAASHELRTPLASLMGFVETLQGPAKDDEEAREQFLGIMAEQARRMSRLIDDLLSLSKIEMEEGDSPNTIVRLEDVVFPVADSLTLTAKERGIRFVFEGDWKAQVIGDKDQLGQVFSNLIENAIKYGHPDSTITIISRPYADDPHLHSVAICDQSPGIAPKHLSRLTERFYRVDKARSRQIGGTGLGLAIVKHILYRHGGRLLISSEQDVGSVFDVLLPHPLNETQAAL